MLARSRVISGVFTARSRRRTCRSSVLVTVCVMREAYTDELESVFSDLASIAVKVETAVARATIALLDGDEGVATEVIDGDAAIDRQREKVEETAFSLLSLQQPVAGDLRTIVAALRMVGELERMGDLSVHIAKVAKMRVPGLAVPAASKPTIAAMGRLAQDMCAKLARIITEQDVVAAAALDTEDDEMDKLRRRSFRELLGEDWVHGVEPAVDLALVGRYYERIADHAVSVANRVVYVVTGEQVEIS